MKCPFCAHVEDKVVDSRESKEGEVIRRRRECLSCGKRFTSYERIDQIWTRGFDLRFPVWAFTIGGAPFWRTPTEPRAK